MTWEPIEEVPRHLWSRECTYPTSEHAFQALKARTLETAVQFEVGGMVSMEIFKSFPEKTQSAKNGGFKLTDTYVKKMAYWGRLKCSGVSAKMVANLSPEVAMAALGLDMMIMTTADGNEETKERTELERCHRIWRPIHVAKFLQNPSIGRSLCRMLMSQMGNGKKNEVQFVERGRFPQAHQKWTAFYDKTTGTLIGKNLMGQLITLAAREVLHLLH